MSAIPLHTEVDPVRTLLVLGPQITALCLSEKRDVSSTPAFLCYQSIVESGIQRALELDTFSRNEARERRGQLLQNAYELEPAFAAHKVTETLHEHNHHESWIREVFQHAKELSLTGDSSSTLQHLSALRREGVRLIYTHYDDLLARALKLPVVLLDDEEGVRKWSQGFPALLHLHGVYSRPQSLKLDCLCYESAIGRSKSASIVREQFQSRMVIFTGYDRPFTDPFLPKLLKSFATPHTMPTTLPLLLSATNEVASSSINDLVTLLIEEPLNLRSLVRVSEKSLGVAPINDSAQPVTMQLVCQDGQILLKFLQTFTNTIHITKQTSDHTLLSVQMSRPTLYRLWSHIFAPATLQKLKGLQVVEIPGSIRVLMHHQIQVEEKSQVLPTTLLPNMATSVSSWGFSPFAISQSLLQGKMAEQFLHKGTLQGVPTSHHEKIMRRIQSENDKLTLQDRLEPTSAEKLRRNGLLQHQSSAPVFPQGIIMGAAPGTLPYAVPSPSILMNIDKKMGEHKIEFIEQQQQQPLKVDRDTSSHSSSQAETSSRGRGKKGDEPFEHKKNKFIKEAREWSRNINDKLNKDSSSEKEEEMGDMMKAAYIHQFTTSATSINSSNGSLQSPPIILPGSPHLKNQSMFIIPSSHSATGAIPTSLLTAMHSLSSKPSEVPIMSNFIPGSVQMATPTLSPDQKLVWVMPNNGLVAATPPQINGSACKETAPKPRTKRTGSPNSDLDYSVPTTKRRRSTSLPDVNHLKPTPSPSSSPTPTPPMTKPLMALSQANGGSPRPQLHSQYFFPDVQLPTTMTGLPLDNCHNESDGGDTANAYPPSPEEGNLHPVPIGRGPIQLWQFLLDLLLDPGRSNLIQWTGNGYEFRILQPEEIAKLWGARKNKPRMNYDKLSRGLRYYYSKGIMDKVPGKKLTFKYKCDIQQYMVQRPGTTSTANPINKSM